MWRELVGKKFVVVLLVFNLTLGIFVSMFYIPANSFWFLKVMVMLAVVLMSQLYRFCYDLWEMVD